MFTDHNPQCRLVKQGTKSAISTNWVCRLIISSRTLTTQTTSMTCILTLARYTSISHHDIVAPVPKRKLSSLKSLDALVSDLLLDQGHSNPLAYNAVFDGQTKAATRAVLKSRSPTSLKLRKDFEEYPRKRELILDNTGSLNRRMEVYHRQRRLSGTFIFRQRNDEDLEGAIVLHGF